MLIFTERYSLQRDGFVMQIIKHQERNHIGNKSTPGFMTSIISEVDNRHPILSQHK